MKGRIALLLVVAGLLCPTGVFAAGVEVSDLSLQGEIMGENIVFTLKLTADVKEKGAVLPLVVGDVAFLDGKLPSNAELVRNGSRFDSRSAEDHLRMKYRRGKRYAPTSEEFVENLASKSYLSKKLYYVECEGAEKMPSGDWLLLRLGEYRAGNHEPPP